MFIETALEFVSATGTNDTLAICRSDDVGLGVRSLINAPRGTVLDRFSGEITSEITQHSLQVRPGLHINKTRFIGYLTHGCDPNCQLDMDRFQLVALRDVVAGELLTIDYAATEDVLHVQFACHCGAANCREWITGRLDPVNPAGLAYLAARPGRSHTA